MTKLKMWKTHPFNQLPKKQTDQSACFDLAFQGHGKKDYKGYSRMNKPFTRVMNNQIVVQPGDRVMVPTGLIMDIPEGYSVRLHPRSGISLKQGVILANCEGVVDSDYVEEVMVLIYNISDNSLTINTGDRIAQGELIRDVDYSIEESAIRPGVKTNRIGGMGSTGVSVNAETITITVAESVQDNPVRKRGRPPKQPS